MANVARGIDASTAACSRVAGVEVRLTELAFGQVNHLISLY